jgi:hypothetical protein
MSLWLSEKRVRTPSSHSQCRLFSFIYRGVKSLFALLGLATPKSYLISKGYEISSLTTEYAEASKGELRRMLHQKRLSVTT